MGYRANATCKTCKERFYLGYGGRDFHEFLEGLFPKHLHKEHELEFYSDEFRQIINDDEWTDSSGYCSEDVMCQQGFIHFKSYDLTEIPQKEWHRYREEEVVSNE
jgi:hypothetical protein